VTYHKANPNIFDIIGIAAMIYVMIRNPDVNTVSLISIILLVRLFNTFVLTAIGDGGLNPYLFYSSIIIANTVMIGIVIARPALISQYGPKFIRDHERITMTHQDSMIAWLYFSHAVLPVLVLIEHIIRHLDDVDFKPMFFYNIYKPTQLILAVLSILVLYFMTFEKSKEARDAKKNI
jgi:hypothetical protein